MDKEIQTAQRHGELVEERKRRDFGHTLRHHLQSPLQSKQLSRLYDPLLQSQAQRFSFTCKQETNHLSPLCDVALQKKSKQLSGLGSLLSAREDMTYAYLLAYAASQSNKPQEFFYEVLLALWFEIYKSLDL